MRKYWQFFKIGFQVTLAYPVPIFFRAVRHSLIVLLFVTLWTALMSSKSEIAGFNLASITTYYLLVEIIDILYTQTPARLLSRDIRTGDLNNFLTKPVDYRKYLFSYTLGQQLAAAWMSLILVVGIFVFFPKIVIFPGNWLYLISFFLFSIGAFIISHEILFAIGTLGFWISEITHLRQGLNQLMGLLGGKWVPLNFFSLPLAGVLNILPFSLLFNFPVKIFQQQISFSQLLTSFIREILWLCLLLIISGYLWDRGVKKYEAYGS